MIWEIASWPIYYSEISEIVYAPKWYYSLGVKPDRYSHLLNYRSKIVDISDYFWSYLVECIDELQRQGHLNELNLITIIPSHKIGVYSPTLDGLAKKLSEYLNVQYEQAISRMENTRKSTASQRYSTVEERYNSVRKSMKIDMDLTGNKVLLLDDVKTTGINILECKKLLLEKGVERTVTVCLGINSSIDRDLNQVTRMKKNE